MVGCEVQCFALAEYFLGEFKVPGDLPTGDYLGGYRSTGEPPGNPTLHFGWLVCLLDERLQWMYFKVALV